MSYPCLAVGHFDSAFRTSDTDEIPRTFIALRSKRLLDYMTYFQFGIVASGKFADCFVTNIHPRILFFALWQHPLQSLRERPQNVWNSLVPHLLRRLSDINRFPWSSLMKISFSVLTQLTPANKLWPEYVHES